MRNSFFVNRLPIYVVILLYKSYFLLHGKSERFSMLIRIELYLKNNKSDVSIK